jgi:hypothetical protein
MRVRWILFSTMGSVLNRHTIIGPERTYALCADFILNHQKTARLRETNSRRAAIFFHDMLTVDLERRMLIGERAKPALAERKALVKAAVDIFVRSQAA